jgi:hypothetical protein
MKGDRVEVLVDAGGAGVQRFEIEATRAGRRIEISTARGIVEVSEVTRGGNAIRSGRFMASRVIALVEHPALETPESGVEETTRRRLGRTADAREAGAGRRGSRREPLDQLALLDSSERMADAAAEGEPEREA